MKVKFSTVTYLSSRRGPLASSMTYIVPEGSVSQSHIGYGMGGIGRSMVDGNGSSRVWHASEASYSYQKARVR